MPTGEHYSQQQQQKRLGDFSCARPNTDSLFSSIFLLSRSNTGRRKNLQRFINIWLSPLFFSLLTTVTAFFALLEPDLTLIFSAFHTKLRTTTTTMTTTTINLGSLLYTFFPLFIRVETVNFLIWKWNFFNSLWGSSRPGLNQSVLVDVGLGLMNFPINLWKKRKIILIDVSNGVVKVVI